MPGALSMTSRWASSWARRRRAGGHAGRRRARPLGCCGAATQALAAALGLFVIITGMHTATHTYFGWRFARGIRAAGAGQHTRAARLLAPVERPGMRHYDPGGDAQTMLDRARAGLR